MSNGKSNQDISWRSAFAAGLFRVKPMLSQASFTRRVVKPCLPVKSAAPKTSSNLKSVRIPSSSSNTLSSKKPAGGLRSLLLPKRSQTSAAVKKPAVRMSETIAPSQQKSYLPGDLRYKPESRIALQLKELPKNNIRVVSNARLVGLSMSKSTLSGAATIGRKRSHPTNGPRQVENDASLALSLNARPVNQSMSRSTLRQEATTGCKRSQVTAGPRQVKNDGRLPPPKENRLFSSNLKHKSQPNHSAKFSHNVLPVKKVIMPSNSSIRLGGLSARSIALPKTCAYDYYEDDYDSEMDDFIDDSMVEELPVHELEETLRRINPRYDKKKYMMREMMIDDRRMDARYKDIQSEEAYSKKVGLSEDLAEARLGSVTTI